MRDPAIRRMELATRIAASAGADELFDARRIGHTFDEAHQSSMRVTCDALEFLLDPPGDLITGLR